VNRSLWTPRWLLLHVLFAAAVVTTGLLAWWQWDRAHGVGGTLQNLGYAFQWPMFGVFAVFLWYKLAIADRRRPAEDESVHTAPEPQAQEQEPARPRRRPLVPPPAQPVSEAEDPELAAYNRYLAELDRSHRR
jgi:DNA-binding transcriptional regulator of glucitol operon